MLGFGWRLLLLAAGGLAGYGLAYGLTIDDLAALLPDETSVQAPGGDPTPEVSARADVAEHTELVIAAEDCEHASAPGATVPAQPSATAVSTSDVVPPWPPTQDPQTPAEWYRAFVSETRDEARASQAEERIAELITEAGPAGLKTEYIRCASRFCTIAGYTNGMGTFDSCTIGGWIGGAAIFRGSLRYSCMDQEYDGRQRFIVFVDSAPGS